MLHAAGRQPDRVRDGNPGAGAVRDDDEAVQPEQITAPVRLRVEALPAAIEVAVAA